MRPHYGHIHVKDIETLLSTANHEIFVYQVYNKIMQVHTIHESQKILLF